MNKSQPNVSSRESRSACDDFWLQASEGSLDAIWDNCGDDIYAELLKPSKTSGESDEHLPRDG
jgi:hypothetical protein